MSDTIGRLDAANATELRSISGSRATTMIGDQLADEPMIWIAGPPVIEAGLDGVGYPAPESRTGSIFTDAGDPTVSWYLPQLRLTTPDVTFAFGAVQDGADSEGRPFNRATIRFGIQQSVPDDVVAAQAATTDRVLRPIPVGSHAASMTLVSHAPDGSEQRTVISGRIEPVDPAGDPSAAERVLQMTVDGLVGPNVLLAFANLTETGTTEIRVDRAYETVRWVDVETTPPSSEGGTGEVLFTPDILLPIERLIELPPNTEPLAEPDPLSDPDPVAVAVVDAATVDTATVDTAVAPEPVTSDVIAQVDSGQDGTIEIAGVEQLVTVEAFSSGLMKRRRKGSSPVSGTRSFAARHKVVGPFTLRASGARPRTFGNLAADDRLLDVRLELEQNGTRLGDVFATDPPTTVPQRMAVRETATESSTILVGDVYGGPSHRPRFTLRAGDVERGIVDADDLEEFHTNQSEYIEITALGSVASRYPTLRALYLGQVSGTVLAIPGAYGIVRTRDGCAVSCDAVIDTAPSSASGCRFQVSCTLGPVVDPGDLARLSADLATEPSLAGRTLRLAMPTDLDRRTPSILQSGNVTNVQFGVGLTPGTFRLTMDVVDDDLPAVVKVNLLLAQLLATTPSLVGRLAVRLDDAHENTVTADVVLNLRVTSGTDDVVIVLDGAGRTTAVNTSPLPIRLISATGRSAAGITTVPLDIELPIAASALLPVPLDFQQVVVDRTLAIADPLPAGGLAKLVSIRAVTVAQVHHAIGFNAAGQITPDVGAVSITVALRDAPEVPVPTINLSAEHPIENTAVEVAVAFAVVGLVATVALSLSPTDGSAPYQRSMEHDFSAHPILTLTHDLLTRGA